LYTLQTKLLSKPYFTDYLKRCL